MSGNTTEGAVSAHYTRGDLAATVESALRDRGLDPAHVTVEQLAPLDHFHSFGVAGSQELARAMGIAAGDRVLDVGGGIGGPARMLASQIGCAVTVLDLTPEFCQVGEMLTAWTHLSDRVAFVCGSALAMPFDDASFDAAWTVHAAMNIEDKPRLYAEIRRVLRPGGRFALFDITAGPNPPVLYPAPWADTPATSFLLPPDELRALVAGAGFRELSWAQGAELVRTIRSIQQPLTDAAGVSGINTALLPGAAGPQNAGGEININVLMGALGPERIQNATRNTQEGRTLIAMGVFERV